MPKRKQEPRLWMAAVCAVPKDMPKTYVFDVLVTEKSYVDKRQALRELKVRMFLSLDPDVYQDHQILETTWVNRDWCLEAFGIDDDDDTSGDDETPTGPEPDDHGVPAPFAEFIERDLKQIGDINWKA